MPALTVSLLNAEQMGEGAPAPLRTAVGQTGIQDMLRVQGPALQMVQYGIICP